VAPGVKSMPLKAVRRGGLRAPLESVYGNCRCVKGDRSSSVGGTTR
jgi:hypothetical protein